MVKGDLYGTHSARLKVGGRDSQLSSLLRTCNLLTSCESIVVKPGIAKSSRLILDKPQSLGKIKYYYTYRNLRIVQSEKLKFHHVNIYSPETEGVGYIIGYRLTYLSIASSLWGHIIHIRID